MNEAEEQASIGKEHGEACQWREDDTQHCACLHHEACVCPETSYQAASKPPRIFSMRFDLITQKTPIPFVHMSEAAYVIYDCPSSHGIFKPLHGSEED